MVSLPPVKATATGTLEILDVPHRLGGRGLLGSEPITHLSDFAGTYVAASAGIAIAGEAGVAVLENQHGVVIKLSSKKQGIQFTLAAEGLRIKLFE